MADLHCAQASASAREMDEEEEEEGGRLLAASRIRVVPSGDEQEALDLARTRTGYLELKHGGGRLQQRDGAKDGRDLNACRSLAEGTLTVQVQHT